MSSLNSTSCCGVGELSDIGQDAGPVETLLIMCGEIQDHAEYDPDDYGRMYGRTDWTVIPPKYIPPDPTWKPRPRPMTLREDELGCHVLFTGVVLDEDEAYHLGKRPKYGQRLAAYIKANHLGTTVKSPARVNPNHSTKGKTHQVVAWLWTVDFEALTKWWLKRVTPKKRTKKGKGKK